MRITLTFVDLADARHCAHCGGLASRKIIVKKDHHETIRNACVPHIGATIHQILQEKGWL